MNKKALTVIIGFIAIALGIGYTLAACGLIEPFTIFVPGWWTVFLIVPGLVMLFSRDSNKFVSLCLITIGVVLFLQKNDLLGDIKKYIIPALLIIFGLSLIINTIINSSKKKQLSPITRQTVRFPFLNRHSLRFVRIILVRILKGVV